MKFICRPDKEECLRECKIDCEFQPRECVFQDCMIANWVKLKGEKMKEMNVNEIEINGVQYVRKDSIQVLKNAPDLNGYDLMCVRTYAAGVFIGYVAETEDTQAGRIVKLLNARRIWKWDGAASLSQLAMEGVKKPENCKFPMEVSEVILINVVEMIPVTEAAKKTIDSVKVWSE